MSCTKDFDLWMAEFGPQDFDELLNLEKVVAGTGRSGCYSGSQAHTGGGWHIRRDHQQALNLTPKLRRAAFKQMLWYYRSGKLKWHHHQPVGLEAFAV
jgi:hypothetical protein